MIPFETILVWTALFRELWVAGRTFTRVQSSLLALLLVCNFAIMAYEARYTEPSGLWLRSAGFVLLILALSLLEWAAFCVRGKFFSYIGNPDPPKFIFISGPYARIRHPFYSSYILTLVAVAMIFPNRVTIAVAVFNFALLWYAAEFEEQKFAATEMAGSYRTYIARTGRFLPRFSR